MFWGLIMEPQRRYTQKVKKGFHISMASLDISTSSDEPAQVLCTIEGRNYLLCTLRKPDVMQCSLDLYFSTGTELAFAANGECHVHLTGYLDETQEEVEEESENELEEPVKKKKRSNENDKNAPPMKKSKVDDDSEENDDDSSDDSEVNVGDLLEKTLEDDENDDSYVEEEEGEDEESEDEYDEEDDSSLSSSEVEEVNSAESSRKSNLKVNGISSKEQSTPLKDKKKKQGADSKLNESKTSNKESKTPNQESKMSKKESKTPSRESKTPSKEIQSPKKKVLQGGVIVEEIKEGQGPIAKAGKFLTVYYEGRFKQNNKLFDSTTKGSGFSFRLGSGEVIKGWDVGFAGMRLGGKRRIVCPPAMAYGAKGSPPAIPANSTLVFEVELKKIR